ncbi:MAG: hypothetical protein ACREMG_14425, partial [Gemmatimonadales bacterium]
MIGALIAAGVAGCGTEEGGEPNPSPLVVEKTSTESGDGQSALLATALGNPLRVVVTRDGEPVQNASVVWSTVSGGTLSPLIDETDAEGISASAWTLGSKAGQQSASATVSGATGSPVAFTATATSGGGGGGGGTTVQV